MNLLDTCTLLWLVAGDKHLSKVSKAEILKNKDFLFVSSISCFEIALKQKRKKLILPQSDVEWFQSALVLHNIKELSVDCTIGAVAANLPDHHNDPFDRIIIATALVNNLSIITPDKDILKYKEIKCIF